MNDILRITAAETISPGVLKLGWNDGYEGTVDLRGILARGAVFEPIRDPEYFKQVRVERYGHHIYWGEDEFTQIDFGCDRLRELAEEQACVNSDSGLEPLSEGGMNDVVLQLLPALLISLVVFFFALSMCRRKGKGLGYARCASYRLPAHFSCFIS
jgi:hypothetical protein